MFRSKSVLAGFNSRAVPVASSRLINAVAASLVIAALSLCACVSLTLMTSGPSVAMPLAH
jgi:hypothetical protein